jgi:Sec-independent protein secretion pathway component TatC
MTLLYELGLLIARLYVPKPAEDEVNAEDSAV